jgi:pimeloyl-ACP methyl ester carboxylesterase
MSLVNANGVRLYYERGGRGPAVLFISGATGDAGHWTGVADALANEYTFVS